MRPLKTLQRKKVMVWIGIVDRTILRPYFFEGNVDSDSYLEMITDFLLPELHRLGYDSMDLCYMHDGAPAHYPETVRQCLNENFGSWIGRGNGALIAWPPRSPDLNPLDFFLWGFLKTQVYRDNPQTLEEIMQKIVENLNEISEQTLALVQNNLLQRLYNVITAEGHHFEHMQ